MGRNQRKTKKRKAAKWRKNRKREIVRRNRQESEGKSENEGVKNKEQVEENEDEDYVSEKWKKIQYKIKCIFEKRRIRLFIVALAGVLFLRGGYILQCYSEINEIPDWKEMGPVIAIACDRPLQGARITCDTSWEGKTTIRIWETELEEILPEVFAQRDDIAERAERTQDISEEVGGNMDDSEEYHMWVYLLSYNTPVGWNIDERAGNIENYEVTVESTEGNFELRKSEELQGIDHATVFRIKLDNNLARVAELEISEPADHVMYRSNEVCRAVLPRIIPWAGNIEELKRYVSDFDFFRSFEKPYIADQDMLKLAINGEPMYFPLLKIDASYAVGSVLWQPELELTVISPESTGGYPLIRWSEYFQIAPVVQFRDTKWENANQRNNLLGGIFMGLGINVLFALPEFLLRKKED